MNIAVIEGGFTGAQGGLFCPCLMFNHTVTHMNRFKYICRLSRFLISLMSINKLLVFS